MCSPDLVSRVERDSNSHPAFEVRAVVILAPDATVEVRDLGPDRAEHADQLERLRRPRRGRLRVVRLAPPRACPSVRERDRFGALASEGVAHPLPGRIAAVTRTLANLAIPHRPTTRGVPARSVGVCDPRRASDIVRLRTVSVGRGVQAQLPSRIRTRRGWPAIPLRWILTTDRPWLRGWSLPSHHGRVRASLRRPMGRPNLPMLQLPWRSPARCTRAWEARESQAPPARSVGEPFPFFRVRPVFLGSFRECRE